METSQQQTYQMHQMTDLQRIMTGGVVLPLNDTMILEYTEEADGQQLSPLVVGVLVARSKAATKLEPKMRSEISTSSCSCEQSATSTSAEKIGHLVANWRGESLLSIRATNQKRMSNNKSRLQGKPLLGWLLSE